jgi:hypothetical protein
MQDFRLTELKFLEDQVWRTVYLSLQTYYAKHLKRLCSISIVKNEHLFLPIF